MSARGTAGTCGQPNEDWPCFEFQVFSFESRNSKLKNSKLGALKRAPGISIEPRHQIIGGGLRRRLQGLGFATLRGI